MEIFNIGPMELLLILVIAVIIFGPEDLVKYSHQVGRWIYKASKSEFWQSVVGTSKEIQEFPKQIMKEAQIEESLKEINSLNHAINGTPPSDPSQVLKTPKAKSDGAVNLEETEKKEASPKEE